MPCVLELGGKCPAVVDPSSNLEYAAEMASRTAFLNSGQLCIRNDYMLIETSIVNDFVKILIDKMEKSFKKGEDRSALGKSINQFHLD